MDCMEMNRKTALLPEADRQELCGTGNGWDSRPVGIFDSGLGGLTVVAAVREKLPDEDLVYLGDTARVPYGNRSLETVMEFARQDLNFLVRKNVKAVVAACNTISAVAIDEMRRSHPEIPVTGVIEPGVEAVLRAGGHRITILGTRTTVRSHAYEQALHRKNPSLEVESIACPLLVPLAEEGILEGPLAEQVFDLYLKDLRKNPPDVLMLGCTHYPLFRKALEHYLPSCVRIIDSAGVCSEMLGEFLAGYGLRAPKGNRGTARFFVTDYSMEFRRQAQCFLGTDVEHLEKVLLG